MKSDLLTIDHESVDVSIVLVTFNRANFIRRTLETIVGQTYPYFEVLICDDCSTDNTEAICQEFVKRDSRFKYVKNKQNLRMPGNLNAGILRARYEFIAILHDGDIYAPTLIEKWREALIKYPSAGFVFNRYRHLSEDGQSGLATGPFPELMAGRDFLKWCFADRELQCPVWGTVMARKAVYERMGPFDPRYGFFSDVDMWFRIAQLFDVAHVPEVLINLPHRRAMPHLFDKFNIAAHSNVFKIYWNAKVNHYRDEPLTMFAQLGMQVWGFIISRARRLLKKTRRRTKRPSAVSRGI